MHLLLQLCPDLLSDLGCPLPCGGGDACPDAHLAFMSVWSQVSLLVALFKFGCSTEVGEGC